MRLAVALALLFAIAANCAAQAQPGASERELAIVNHGTHAINEVYVSPSVVDQWGEDRLGDQTVAPGHSAHLKLGRLRDCEFDIQVIYENASREEAHGVNLCRSRQVAFDGSAATPAAPAPTHDVAIANRAGRPIQQVLVSPSDAGDWGDDRLGDRSISVGDSATINYQGGCTADLRVVFDNRSAEERRGLDLCVQRQLAIEPGWTTAELVASGPASGPGSGPGSGMEPVLLTVTNHAGHAAAQLFLFPEGSGERGPDLLASGGLEDGAAVNVTFQRPTATCRFAAHVVFGGKRADEDIAGLDLCHSTAVVLRGRV